MHSRSFKGSVLPSFDELQMWRPDGGRGDRVIYMPTKLRLEVRSENYNFLPSLTESNQKLKSNSELVTFDLYGTSLL